MYVCCERDAHEGRLRAWQLPRLPPDLSRGAECKSLTRGPPSGRCRTSRPGIGFLCAHSAPPEALPGAEDERGVYEREVGEGLGEVPQEAAGLGVVLLREQPDVVSEVEQPLEELARLLQPALEREGVREPEGARQEDALAARQAIDAEILRA